MSTVGIDEHTYTRPDLPRLIEQQVLDFGRLIWSDGFMPEDRFRDRMHEVPDDTTHFVRSAGSLLVSHVQVIPIHLEGRDGPLVIGGISSVMTYPPFRGEGHGSALLRRAAEHIDAKGLHVGMLCGDRETIPFYERLGWDALEHGRVAVQDDQHGDDDVMVLGDDGLLADRITREWSW